MSSIWKTGKPGELVSELRTSGVAYAESGRLPRILLPLLKTILIDSLRKLPPDHDCIWRIGGDPATTERYAANRRHIVIWLGK
jgi:hypothetical protein